MPRVGRPAPCAPAVHQCPGHWFWTAKRPRRWWSPAYGAGEVLQAEHSDARRSSPPQARPELCRERGSQGRRRRVPGASPGRRASRGRRGKLVLRPPRCLPSTGHPSRLPCHQAPAVQSPPGAVARRHPPRQPARPCTARLAAPRRLPAPRAAAETPGQRVPGPEFRLRPAAGSHAAPGCAGARPSLLPHTSHAASRRHRSQLAPVPATRRSAQPPHAVLLWEVHPRVALARTALAGRPHHPRPQLGKQHPGVLPTSSLLQESTRVACVWSVVRAHHCGCPCRRASRACGSAHPHPARLNPQARRSAPRWPGGRRHRSHQRALLAGHRPRGNGGGVRGAQGRWAPSSGISVSSGGGAGLEA
mmetsp:Transcript_9345/g.26291  ORF Transcript_9345/g.26291 Transcript_9345/m.26291 type:complete len:361 (-) Transcript_9345:1-1083(-)